MIQHTIRLCAHAQVPLSNKLSPTSTLRLAPQPANRLMRGHPQAKKRLPRLLRKSKPFETPWTPWQRLLRLPSTDTLRAKSTLLPAPSLRYWTTTVLSKEPTSRPFYGACVKLLQANSNRHKPQRNPSLRPASATACLVGQPRGQHTHSPSTDHTMVVCLCLRQLVGLKLSIRAAAAVFLLKCGLKQRRTSRDRLSPLGRLLHNKFQEPFQAGRLCNRPQASQMAELRLSSSSRLDPCQANGRLSTKTAIRTTKSSPPVIGLSGTAVQSILATTGTSSPRLSGSGTSTAYLSRPSLSDWAAFCKALPRCSILTRCMSCPRQQARTVPADGSRPSSIRLRRRLGV